MAIDIIRKYEQALDKAQRALDLARFNRKRIRHNEQTLCRHEGVIVELIGRVEDLEELQEDDDEENGGDGETPFYPYGPRSVSELRQFIIWKWGPGILVEGYEESMQPVCRVIRDSIAVVYPGIALVNKQLHRHNYEAPLDRHLDAFVVIGERPEDDYIVDYMYGSSEGGTVEDKLRWGLGGGTGKPDNVDWSIAWG